MTTQTTSNGMLAGKRIAILATDGFEQSELEKPRRAFEEAGAKTVIVSLEKKDIQGMNHDEKGDRFAVGLVVADARESDFDALLLPGGVKNPDTLRTDEGAVAFVKAFATAGKPIAAICHGPWTLVEADVVRGRNVTSYPSIKTDLKNAGARWVDQEVVTDAGLVTSRKPDDIPAFVAKAIEAIAEGNPARKRSTLTPKGIGSMHAPSFPGDDRGHLDRLVLDPNAPEAHVGEDSSDEIAEPVEATRQRRTATVLEHIAGDDEGAANRTGDTKQQATHALEGAETGTPSRKSTRGGANHVKPDSQLQRRQVNRATTPKARAARGK